MFNLIDKTEIPLAQILPTHINRNIGLFEMGLEYVKKGELRAGEALKRSIDEKLPMEHIKHFLRMAMEVCQGLMKRDI